MARKPNLNNYPGVDAFPSTRKGAKKGEVRYRQRYTGADGKRYWSFHDFAHEAAAEREKQLQAIREHRWVPPEVSKAEARRAQEAQQLTVGTWVMQWLDTKRGKSRESTLQTYERTIRNRITEVEGAPGVAKLATIPLADLKKRDVYAWWDEMAKVFPTPTTNRNAYIHLRSACNEAVEREIMPSNPVDVKAARVKPTPKEKELPKTADMQAILAATPERYKLAVVLFLFMGLRIGEALGLKRSQIVNEGTPDAPQWVAQVRGNIQDVQDGKGATRAVEQPPKTKAGRRDVPIFTEFNDVVQAHLDSFTGAPGDYLTTTGRGNPVKATSMRNILARAKDRAGVTAKITPHYGRNWLITHLAQNGATPAEIGQVLGQTDLKTITEVYMKVSPEHTRTVLAKVSAEQFGSGGDVI
ncbi:tyrosine-type recombinase/integrase [Corynebacterium sp. 320]|uniref:tyrosine-type recombinase/integrase n=1 Tax=Corynebacterium TaxID=1716 RepID=UPI00125CC6FB|nr:MULTISPECIES: site-specific integrase [Corynebacterium]KAB1502741.1 tyrosine-type recombinase/integrase [Corynebacterium sp. 320]KAB1550521.1 tyrosine-type recombinase/integrase [Corynebacterium sp. 319]KAB3526404.1 tyrosine-type recombinase/integrase [Corynebacterium sp. 250]KAB1554751.1 tyrosine-type recombinase/integrase [Corynebacterium sp. 321]KAB3537747.1 tyrosine-type recombinase/integrase [Corynebacterium sp. 366]